MDEKSGQPSERWFVPISQPEEPCGCFYSAAGYPLFLCHGHAQEEYEA